MKGYWSLWVFEAPRRQQRQAYILELGLGFCKATRKALAFYGLRFRVQGFGSLWVSGFRGGGFRGLGVHLNKRNLQRLAQKGATVHSMV